MLEGRRNLFWLEYLWRDTTRGIWVFLDPHLYSSSLETKVLIAQTGEAFTGDKHSSNWSIFKAFVALEHWIAHLHSPEAMVS